MTTLKPAALRDCAPAISMVFQHFALLPAPHVAENAAYALRVRGVDKATEDGEGGRGALHGGAGGLGGPAARRNSPAA